MAVVLVVVMTTSIITMMLGRREEVVEMELRRNYRRIARDVDRRDKKHAK